MIQHLLKKHKKILLLATVSSFQFCKKPDNSSVVPASDLNRPLSMLAVNNSQDIAAITWTTAKAQPIATHELQGEVVQGKLYIFGGFDVNKRPQWTPTKRSYSYDPNTDTWKAIKSLPHEPFGSNFGGGTHVAIATDGVDIYLAGGYTSNSAGTGQIFGTKQVWKYNVNSNDYTKFPDLPKALAAGQLRFLNGKLHYIGGADQNRKDSNIHLVLDLNNTAAGWKTLAPLNNAVNHPGGAVYNGKIYIMGGSHNQNEASVPQRTLQVYDDQTNTWTNMADMPLAIDHILSSVVIYSNRIVVLGGQTAHNTPGKQVFSYNPETNVWSVLSPMRAAKSAGVAAVLNNNIHYTGGNFSALNYKGVIATDVPSMEILPSADLFVRNGSFGTTNYGSDTLLTVKGANVNYLRKAYLKFDLTNTSTINSATLSVYGKNVDSNADIALSVFGVENNSWLENGLTFNNSPQQTSSVLSNAAVSSQAKRVSFDVTSFVKAQLAIGKEVSFVIADPANKNLTVQFNSKESSANKPTLIIK